MPDLVINTGPVIALTAAVESLQFLNELYEEILIPVEVIRELEAGGANCPELAAIRACSAIFSRMHEKGVWISETLQEQALHAVRSN